MSKSYAEQIADLQATRTEKSTRMVAIQSKATEQARTLDTGEQEEFDTAKAAIATIDKNIGNLRDLEAMEKADQATATAVTDTDKRNSTVSTKGVSVVQAKNTEKLEPGMGFARMARVKALAHINHEAPEQIAQHLYPGDDTLVKSFQKAAVPAASTGVATWAGNLILDAGGYFADFVEYSRATSVMGQIAPRLRRLPFDTQVLVQASAGVAKWTAEGDAKPLTQWTYTRAKLAPLKVAAIAAATKEMLSRASIAADTLIRDELARAVNTAIDGTFVSAAAAVTGESPAGIRNGISALTLNGDGTVFGVRCDIAQFLKELAGDNLSVSGAFWVMSELVAIDLSLATNEVGTAAFPGVTPTGGTLAGLPIYTSQTVPTNVVMLVKGDEIFLGDEGGIQVNISDQASLQMDDTPTQSSIGTPTATSVVSMFQTNSVAFLVERFLNWQLRRPGAVVWATVNWDPCTT